MSSILMLKDFDTKKLNDKGEKVIFKKDQIVSVPFGEGKRLIAEKMAIYPEQPKQMLPVVDLEKEAMRAEIAAKQKQIDDLLEASTAPAQTNVVDPLKKK